jgi:elongation factor 1-gamma
MPPFATLHTTNNFLHARVTKTLAAANINGLEITIAPGFIYGSTNKAPEYLAKFPHGKIPALETPSGFYLSESTAIAFYVAESGPAKDQLLGKTPEERALVQMWIALSDNEIFTHSNPILAVVMAQGKYYPDLIEDREVQLLRAIQRLEDHLTKEGKVWLVRDDEISLADLSVAASLYWPLRFFLDPETREKYPRTMEWWERLMGVEGVGKAFAAPVEFCKERPVMKEH